jgi:hypothetical protein
MKKLPVKALQIYDLFCLSAMNFYKNRQQELIMPLRICDPDISVCQRFFKKITYSALNQQLEWFRAILQVIFIDLLQTV